MSSTTTTVLLWLGAAGIGVMAGGAGVVAGLAWLSAWESISDRAEGIRGRMDRMDQIEVYRADDGWRWRRKAGNGEIIASGEAHTRRPDARRAAERANPDEQWTFTRSSFEVP